MMRQLYFIILSFFLNTHYLYAQQPQTPPSGFSIRITPSDSKRGSALPTSVNPRGDEGASKSKKTDRKTSETKRNPETLQVTTTSEPKPAQKPKKTALNKKKNQAQAKNQRRAKKRDSKKLRKIKKSDKRRAERRKKKTSRKRKKAKKSKLTASNRSKKSRRSSKPASNSKREKRRSRDSKNAYSKIKKTLKGSGAKYAESSPWGQLETLPVRIAAQVRQYVDGSEESVKSPVEFEGASALPTARSRAALAAFADFLKARSNILLVLIEGHGNLFGDRLRDQLLSRARASAVREFLINKGINSNRLVAFGVGNQMQRGTGDRARDTQVYISYVNGPPSKRIASTRWDQFAVVDLVGTAIYSVDAKRKKLQIKEQIDPRGTVTLDSKSQLTLRAPDGSTIGMRGTSSIALNSARFSNVNKKIEANLHYGEFVIRHDPSRSRRSKLQLSLGDRQTLSAGSATIRLAKDKNQIWLAIDQGHVQISVGKVSGLTLGQGQSYLSVNGATSVWRQLEAPLVETQTTGHPPKDKTLKWKSNPNAAAYRVEFSTDTTFAVTVFSKMTTGNEFQLDDDLPSGTLFWRVSPVDERGIPGQYSGVFIVDKDLKHKRR